MKKETDGLIESTIDSLLDEKKAKKKAKKRATFAFKGALKKGRETAGKER